MVTHMRIRILQDCQKPQLLSFYIPHFRLPHRTFPCGCRRRHHGTLLGNACRKPGNAQLGRIPGIAIRGIVHRRRRSIRFWLKPGRHGHRGGRIVHQILSTTEPDPVIPTGILSNRIILRRHHTPGITEVVPGIMMQFPHIPLTAPGEEELDTVDSFAGPNHTPFTTVPIRPIHLPHPLRE